MEIYHTSVMEARGLKLVCWGHWLFLKSVRESILGLFPNTRQPQVSLGCRRHSSFVCLSVCPSLHPHFPFLREQSHFILGFTAMTSSYVD